MSDVISARNVHLWIHSLQEPSAGKLVSLSMINIESDSLSLSVSCHLIFAIILGNTFQNVLE